MATFNGPKMISCVGAFLLLAASPFLAQEAKISVSYLDKLATKADHTVDVNLDASLLQLAAKFLSGSKPDEAKVKELIGGLKGIYVRSFEFESDNTYSIEDLNGVRSQLQGPGWVRMVGVRSKRDGENVEVFTLSSGEKVKGLAILCAQPKELTFVNIVGTIDLEKLSELEGQLGIPKLGLEGTDKAKKDQKDKGNKGRE